MARPRLIVTLRTSMCASTRSTDGDRRPTTRRRSRLGSTCGGDRDGHRVGEGARANAGRDTEPCRYFWLGSDARRRSTASASGCSLLSSVSWMMSASASNHADWLNRPMRGRAGLTSPDVLEVLTWLGPTKARTMRRDVGKLLDRTATAVRCTQLDDVHRRGARRRTPRAPRRSPGSARVRRRAGGADRPRGGDGHVVRRRTSARTGRLLLLLDEGR